jgi:hypothetical protein
MKIISVPINRFFSINSRLIIKEAEIPRKSKILEKRATLDPIKKKSKIVGTNKIANIQAFMRLILVRFDSNSSTEFDMV